ncbi:MULTISPECIES: helix-turn-helix transcriptional regulator [unclassified Paenibacillus]|uniref:helix-turn-helix transcriptional regulator n=1 Tax=unclassified Paenibacillus TaxID=185978 RepID=UPI0009AED41E|nr:MULTISPECIES: helix-turn-helix domain-containing protein [unclassified Paenibacillus]MBE1444974.1 AraC-like DNA-binding protein [Paenibacillus sp. OAS669]
MKDHFYFPGFFTSFHVWSILYKNAEKGSVYPNHKHPMFEILYIESGFMSEWINGIEYELRAGDFILVNSGELHYPQAHEESRFFNFHFDVEPREVHSLFHRRRQPIVSTQQPPEIQSEIRHSMNRLIQLFKSLEEPAFTQKMMVQSMMMQFLAFLIEKIVIPDIRDEPSAPKSKHTIAAEAAYLLETYGGAEGLKISELSERLHVHRNYITDCFKQVYGMSPKHYLNKVRIEKAKKLLQESTLSVEDIALKLNFSSAAYFCKFFRAQVGTTPFQYRCGVSAKVLF